MKYIGAAVKVRNVPSRPGFVKLKVNTFIMGEYKASANDIIIMKIIKSVMFIPKNIGIGPVVAILHPNNIKSYASYFFYIGDTQIRNKIIRIGAMATYIPNGASSP